MAWEMKNRWGKSELNFQLYKIEREYKDEMRMHNTFAQQFKAKRSKINFYSDNARKGNTSGFDYRRYTNTMPAPKPPTSVRYEDIHAMLFTDGKLDIDKILCLHLLTAHRAETLVPPVKTRRPLSFLAKDQSPLEKLIERSRRRRTNTNHPQLKPTYVLDIASTSDINNDGEEASKDTCLIKDGRLAERIIINDKITMIIHTVLDALQTSNPEKMAELLTKARDEEELKRIIAKPALQDFLKTLQKQHLVTSCDSFHLSQPFKMPTVPLQVEPVAFSLKSLVCYIRKNVLQNPMQSTWGDMYDKEVGIKEEMISSYFYEKSASKQSVIESPKYGLDLYGNETKPENSKNSQRTTHRDVPKGSRSTDSTEGDDALAASKRRRTPITNLEQIDDDNIGQIGVDKLAIIVDHQLKKLHSEDKRAKKNQKASSTKPSKNTARGKMGFKSSTDSVELNVFDLAMISQEIREKETQQKLERFLKNAQ